MTTNHPLASLVLVIALLVTQSFSVQAAFDPAKDVSVELSASADSLPAGRSTDLTVIFKMPEGYHIASLESGNFWVEFDTTIQGLEFAAPAFPKGHMVKAEEVFGPEVAVKSSVTASKDATSGARTLKALVSYQICTETGAYQCFMPVEKEVTLVLTISEASSPLTSNATTEPPQESNKPTAISSSNPGLLGSLESALAKGSFAALFLVFIGGILSSFTPCVYPIIPITISYIGGRAQGSKFSGFFLSLFFVLGLAIMYSCLGIIAALSGGVFGGLTQNPIVYGVLIFIFIAMGASMMGAFDLQLPASWQGKLQGGKKKGAVGAMFMGAASGLIAAPCVGPILVALLTWVAKTGSVLVGFGLLFSYSLGMGMLFIVIGTFAGALTALPQAGQWMENVKHFFGWLLWGTAVFFAGFILPKSVMPLLWGAYLTLLGTYIGAFKPFSEPHSWKWTIGKWIGILSVVTGLFFFILGLAQVSGWSLASTTGLTGQASQPAAHTGPEWIVNDEPGAFARAAVEGMPLMMDFYADWCAACKELDYKTYNQPEIIARAAGFISLKMDFTKQNDWSKEMIKKYNVAGMPTVIFFAPDGRELERFTGFKEAAEVAQIMDRVK
jgi:thiol:disulfide interchange protein DsbD